LDAVPQIISKVLLDQVWPNETPTRINSIATAPDAAVRNSHLFPRWLLFIFCLLRAALRVECVGPATARLRHETTRARFCTRYGGCFVANEGQILHHYDEEQLTQVSCLNLVPNVHLWPARYAHINPSTLLAIRCCRPAQGQCAAGPVTQTRSTSRNCACLSRICSGSAAAVRNKINKPTYPHSVSVF
jgi:hypothetical protein